jgi:hypothetical protein
VPAAALLLVAFDPQPAEALEQLGVGDARRLEQLRVDARRGEAGHRVELVDEHALAVDEEVDARETVAAEMRAGTIRSMPPAVYLAA